MFGQPAEIGRRRRRWRGGGVMRTYIIAVHMAIKAENTDNAIRAAVRGLNEGVNDIGEIEEAAITGIQTVVQKSSDAPTQMTLLDRKRVRTGSGRWLVVGRCPMCGRNVTASMANKTGVRCRYEGAQFDTEGRYLWNAATKPGKTPGTRFGSGSPLVM